MSRVSRKPRKAPRPTEPAIAPIHYRDPDGDNEHSHCRAEERATYTGEPVICSTNIIEVTCKTCLVTVDSKAYHADESEEYKQLRQYPDAWIELSKRFKVGDKIRWLRSDGVNVPDPHGKPLDHLGFGRKPLTDKRYSYGNRRNMIGTVTEVRNGKRWFWPPRWYDDEDGSGGNWLAERYGWLVVDFPGGNRFDADGNLVGTIAVHAEEEGSVWEVHRGS